MTEAANLKLLWLVFAWNSRRMRKSIKCHESWESITNDEKVWGSATKLEKVCQILRNQEKRTKRWESPKKCVESYKIVIK